MKKLFGSVFVIFLVIPLLCCCGQKNIKHGAYEKIYEKYNNLNFFEAEAEVSVKSNFGTSTYAVKQYYLSPNNYKTEVIGPEISKGMGYSFCDGKLYLKSPEGEEFSLGDYASEDKGYIFINDFFEEYYKSESALAETGKAAKSSSTLLKCTLSEKNPKRHRQCLWINNISFLPEKLVTYDIDGNEVITVTYKSFSADKKPDREIFKN